MGVLLIEEFKDYEMTLVQMVYETYVCRPSNSNPVGLSFSGHSYFSGRVLRESYVQHVFAS